MTTPAQPPNVRALLDAAKPLSKKSSLLWLLLFKRVCDRWEEEHGADGQRQSVDAPAAHRLVIPVNHSWADVRRHPLDIGDALNAAFRAVDEANPRLAGLFCCLDFSDREVFPPSILRQVFERFDAIRIRGSDVNESAFGTMCDALMQEAAESADRSVLDSITPQPIAHLLAEILQPQEGMSIYDGACGSGGMFVECCQYLKKLGRNHESLRFYGQEIDPESWSLCRINLACHGIHHEAIEKGDTLRSPRHLAGDGRALMTFDRVISHPPFNRAKWGFEEWSPADRYGRSEYGLPPRSSGDLAFIEHSLSSLNSRGMLGVVAPLGVLTRAREEGEIRRRMVRDDLVEAVITIGHGVLAPSSMPACLLIMNRAKPPEHRGTILLVNAEPEAAIGPNGGLSAESVDRISAVFRSWGDQEGFCRVISQEEIERSGAALSVARYVPAGAEGPRNDVGDEWRTLLTLIEERNEAERTMTEHIRRLERGSDES